MVVPVPGDVRIVGDMTPELPLLAALWIAYLAGRAMEAARHTPASPPQTGRGVRS